MREKQPESIQKSKGGMRIKGLNVPYVKVLIVKGCDIGGGDRWAFPFLRKGALFKRGALIAYKVLVVICKKAPCQT